MKPGSGRGGANADVAAGCDGHLVGVRFAKEDAAAARAIQDSVRAVAEQGVICAGERRRKAETEGSAGTASPAKMGAPAVVEDLKSRLRRRLNAVQPDDHAIVRRNGESAADDARTIDPKEYVLVKAHTLPRGGCALNTEDRQNVRVSDDPQPGRERVGSDADIAADDTVAGDVEIRRGLL